jgi:Na+-transporting methylmalonyl-CoA/oxaloacetate decarboxylase gamma subunit
MLLVLIRLFLLVCVIRILYSKLEFVPEERFSPAARSLLEGLINR